MSDNHRAVVFHGRTETACYAVGRALVSLIPAFFSRWLAAIGAILVICGRILTVYHFDIDNGRRAVTVQTLWLGDFQMKCATCAFTGVGGVREEVGKFKRVHS